MALAERAAGVAAPEQPTAPYLDAVWGYGFRGSARFHVPGHKGGAGADPGLRTALGERRADGRRARRTSTASTSGPRRRRSSARSSSPPRRYGAARSVVPHQRREAGQPRAVPGAGAARRAVVVQRNSHAIDRRRPRALAAASRAFVAPEYEAELGMAHGVAPGVARPRWRPAPAPRAAFIVSPTYYGMAADVAGLRGGLPRRRRAARRRPGVGSALRLPPRPAAERAGARRRRGAHLDAQDRRLADAVGDAARRARRRSIPTRSRARCARALDVALLAAARSLDAARRQLAVHGEALLADAARRSRRGARRSTRSRRARDRRRVGRPARRRGLGPDADRDRRARDRLHRLRGRRRLREAYDVHVELADARDDGAVLGLGQRPEALERFAHDFDAVVRRIGRPGAPRRSCGRRGRWRTRWWSRRARRSSARPRWSPVDDAVGRVSARVDRRLPAGHPGAAAGRADHDRAGRVPARAGGLGRAAARRERPGVRNHLGAGCSPSRPAGRARRVAEAAADRQRRLRRSAVGRPAPRPRRGDGMGLLALHPAPRAASVAIVMSLEPARAGERWAFIGLAAHPGGFFRWAALQGAMPTRPATGPRRRRVLRGAGPDGGSTSGGRPPGRATMPAPVAWPRRASVGGGAHARRRSLVLGIRTCSAGARAACRRRRRRSRSTAPAATRRTGAPASPTAGGGGRRTTSATRSRSRSPAVRSAWASRGAGDPAAVVRLDGTVLRCRPPAAAALGDGAWRLRARAGGTASRSRAPRTRRRPRAHRPGRQRSGGRPLAHHLAGCGARAPRTVFACGVGARGGRGARRLGGTAQRCGTRVDVRRRRPRVVAGASRPAGRGNQREPPASPACADPPERSRTRERGGRASLLWS